MAHLTEAGLKVLRAKLEALKTQRGELERRRAEVYEMCGDGWHDNMEFESMQAEDKRLSAAIAKLQNELTYAEIVAAPAKHKAGVGSKVEIEFPDGIRKIFEIGDAHSADPAAGIISAQSPLGKALMGVKVGQRRQYNAGEREIFIMVLSIT